MTRKPRILLGVSGSVAAVKAPELALRLHAFADVRVVVTASAEFFLARAKEYDAEHAARFEAARDAIPVIRDADEWAAWNVVGDPVVHIDLKDWADMVVIAPLSANTLAKLANGLSDNLLTCVARAWTISKPIIVAPAMNTDMWNHPLTDRHLRVLEELNYKIIPPVEKRLACGVVGACSLSCSRVGIDCRVYSLGLVCSLQAKEDSHPWTQLSIL
ncbi:hypothetical protein PINS_up008702 [Pythium insidiosum]|nr:hypothetical protein PINS_up008702 [Pythium insidiosum]